MGKGLTIGIIVGVVFLLVAVLFGFMVFNKDKIEVNSDCNIPIENTLSISSSIREVEQNLDDIIKFYCSNSNEANTIPKSHLTNSFDRCLGDIEFIKDSLDNIKEKSKC